MLFLFRLNFSTAWSTNTVSICHSAGLTNITRVELSRRFLIKVCTHREGMDVTEYISSGSILRGNFEEFSACFSDLSYLFLSCSPRTERAWRTSVVILRSWLNVCMTTWPNASISVPSLPSPWRWNHSRCLRWTFWLKAAQLWREPTMIWVSVLLFPSLLLLPSLLHSLTCVLLSPLACLSLLLHFSEYSLSAAPHKHTTWHC